MEAKAQSTLPRLVFFLHLRQDREVLFPLIEASVESGRIVEVWVRRGLHAQDPQLTDRVRRLGITPKVLSWWRLRTGLFLNWRLGDALITASESTAPPHRLSYHLTCAAKRRGVRTFTLQHGLENVGLTYFDSEYPPGSVEFASDRILIWGPLGGLHPSVGDKTREKCVSVGVPKKYSVLVSEVPQSKQTRVAIFENLHWSRYDSHYTASFERDLLAVIAHYPEIEFVLKGHPSSQWVRAFAKKLSGTTNVHCVDAEAANRDFSGAAVLLHAAAAVITTPSTVALDAAFLDRPVAVATYDLDLDFYKPLPLLRNEADWHVFLAEAHVSEFHRRAERFRETHTVGLVSPPNLIARIDQLSG
ncbi:MAG: hypothetical protein KDD51_02275 [Bdellovibrionales bacterium]|nr:hypothetical protein [Bdellovibrionales bacterium]